jgi:hypothetical protein
MKSRSVFAFLRADCVLGVLVWGAVFIISVPITLSAFLGMKACLSGHEKVLFETLDEIATPDNLTLHLPESSTIQLPFNLRAPNGWQTGLIISVILFTIGLLWKFGS